MIKPEDKAFVCINRKENGFCPKIQHTIKSGYASKTHCKNCSFFQADVL